MQNTHFGSKIKIPKNMSKSILQIIYSCSLPKKPLQNTLNIQQMRAFSKSAIMHAKAIAHADTHFGSKIKIPKNMSKSILQIIYSCSLQKTAPKNTKYSRNESIFKIGHHACKGYSPCKILTLAQKLKFQKTCQNPFYNSFTVVLCKKPLPKARNIREMRAFSKSRHACKGYSPCKILTLAQKIKLQKTCQNQFFKSVTVVLCQKPLQKILNTR